MKTNVCYQGDCLDVLPTLPSNSVDSIVTDPPYELGFMGKSWDNSGIAYNVDMWKECLRVLKPGGHLLSFSGTRTYHRMAVAIEDAGFEVRDMIEWVYGCLSEDTEILTESGYKPLHKLTQYDRIGVYDITNNIYKWERPQGYSVYKVHQDTAYRIKSDYTDQIVSRNHRCLVEREGKLVFVTAEELKEMEYMPTLSEDFYSLQEGHRKLLLKELLWKGKRLAQKLFSKWTRKEVSSERIEVRKEPSLERWSNLLEETRKLQADKICEVSEGVFTDGKKRWICNGTSFDSGSILGDMFRENPSSASYQSRPTGQPTGKSDVISIKQGTQITRRARVEKIEYSGIIFCPTVSTGAFIARRNGQVFITGNSGFPKSLNIGKAVDKRGGTTSDQSKEFAEYIKNKRTELNITLSKADEVICGGTTNYSWFEGRPAGQRLPRKADYLKMKELLKLDDRYDSFMEETEREFLGNYETDMGGLGGERLGVSGGSITKGTSEWEGWGTALKPSHEPVVFCSKPLTPRLYFAILIGDISNNIIQLCQISNVKDAEKIFSGIQAKLEKEGVLSVADNVRINAWESLENVKFAEKSFTSKEQKSSDLTKTKENSAQLNAKQNGKKDNLQEIKTLAGVEANIKALMDIIIFGTTENTSQNIALLWNSISEELLNQANTLTISMATRLITDLKILKLSATQSILESTGSLFKTPQNIPPNHEPICMARKPLGYWETKNTLTAKEKDEFQDLWDKMEART